MKNWRGIIFLLILIAASQPVLGWYFYTAINGQRLKWVFSSSCNPNARPIRLYFDSDTPSNLTTYDVRTTEIPAVIANWDAPYGTSLALFALGDYNTAMDVTASNSFMQNPSSGQIWVVWDTDGAVLQSLGVDTSAGTDTLGIGIPLQANPDRPQDICAGIVILNASLIVTGVPASTKQTYQQVLQHELGHVLGFAHSIVGANGHTITLGNPNPAAKLPVMFPFLVTGASSLLNPDDKAAVMSLYGN